MNVALPLFVLLVAYVVMRSRAAAGVPFGGAAPDPGKPFPFPWYPVPLSDAESAALAIVARVNAEMGAWFDDLASVMAIIEIESGFDPSAYRFEPRLGEASFGLMQVLESSARDRGYQGPPEGLFDPETNIRLGMAQLRWSWDYLAARAPLGVVTEAAWIGSYNAGVGNAARGYLPTGYVEAWRRARDAWRARLAVA